MAVSGALDRGLDARRLGLHRLSRANERFVIGVGTLAGVLVAWELTARLDLIDPLFISAPSLIARAGYSLMADGEIWPDLEVSATEFLLGYALAAAVGIPLGLASGWYRRLSYLLSPFVDMLNAVPR